MTDTTQQTAKTESSGLEEHAQQNGLYRAEGGQSVNSQIEAQVSRDDALIDEVLQENAQPPQISLETDRIAGEAALAGTSTELQAEPLEVVNQRIDAEAGLANSTNNLMNFVNDAKSLMRALRTADLIETLGGNLQKWSDKLGNLAERSNPLIGWLYKAAGWLLDHGSQLCQRAAGSIREFVQRFIERKEFERRRVNQFSHELSEEKPLESSSDISQNKSQKFNLLDEESESRRLTKQLEDERDKKLHAALADIDRRLLEKERDEQREEQEYWQERDRRSEQVDILEALHPELDASLNLRAYENEQVFPMQLTLEELEFRAKNAELLKSGK